MTCDILDFRCILVNEIIGNIFLAMIILAIGYFIIAIKMRLSFEKTIIFLIPIMLGAGIIITGFSAIYALITIVAGLLLAFGISRFIGNK